VTSWWAAAAKLAAAELRCSSAVSLPAQIPDAGERPACPSHPEFYGSGKIEYGVFVEGEESKARLLRHASEEAAEGAAMPDCRHEIGVQLTWSRMDRRHLQRKEHATSVNMEVVGGEYLAKLYRAPSHAMYATSTVGVLKRIQLVFPGKHFIGAHRLGAELHLEHEGRHPTDPKFKVVMPLEIGWAWHETLSPVMDFLGSDRNQVDWKCDGWEWVKQGFKCPPFILASRFLATNTEDELEVLHFGSEGKGDCQEHTFFIMKSVRVAVSQLEKFNFTAEDLSNHQLPEFDERTPPRQVVVSVALGPDGAFRVFSTGELIRRKMVYFGVVFLLMLALVGAFCLVRRCSGIYEVDMVDFAMDHCLNVNLRVDHWVCYIAAIAVPVLAYFQGSTNRITGMPYEWLGTYFAVVYCHCIHELVMYVQIGGSAKKIGYGKVAMCTVMSAFTLLHYNLQVQFMVIAWMHGSWCTWSSLIVFLLSNIFGQLVWFTRMEESGQYNMDMFKARGLEVVNAVFQARMQDKSQDKSQTDKFSSDGRYLLVSGCGDVCQLLIMMSYIARHGQTPVVMASMTLTAFFMLSGCGAAYLRRDM